MNPPRASLSIIAAATLAFAAFAFSNPGALPGLLDASGSAQMASVASSVSIQPQPRIDIPGFAKLPVLCKMPSDTFQMYTRKYTTIQQSIVDADTAIASTTKRIAALRASLTKIKAPIAAFYVSSKSPTQLSYVNYDVSYQALQKSLILSVNQIASSTDELIKAKSQGTKGAAAVKALNAKIAALTAQSTKVSQQLDALGLQRSKIDVALASASSTVAAASSPITKSIATLELSLRQAYAYKQQAVLLKDTYTYNPDIKQSVMYEKNLKLIGACAPVVVNIESSCGDGLDNDGNGNADCRDTQCSESPECKPKKGTASQTQTQTPGRGTVAWSDCSYLGDHALYDPTASCAIVGYEKLDSTNTTRVGWTSTNGTELVPNQSGTIIVGGVAFTLGGQPVSSAQPAPVNTGPLQNGDLGPQGNGNASPITNSALGPNEKDILGLNECDYASGQKRYPLTNEGLDEYMRDFMAGRAVTTVNCALSACSSDPRCTGPDPRQCFLSCQELSNSFAWQDIYEERVRYWTNRLNKPGLSEAEIATANATLDLVKKQVTDGQNELNQIRNKIYKEKCSCDSNPPKATQAE